MDIQESHSFIKTDTDLLNKRTVDHCNASLVEQHYTDLCRVLSPTDLLHLEDHSSSQQVANSGIGQFSSSDVRNWLSNSRNQPGLTSNGSCDPSISIENDPNMLKAQQSEWHGDQNGLFPSWCHTAHLMTTDVRSVSYTANALTADSGILESDMSPGMYSLTALGACFLTMFHALMLRLWYFRVGLFLDFSEYWSFSPCSIHILWKLL